MKEENISFGEYIRKKRLSGPQELTQQDVANHLGISFSYVSMVEKRRKPPFDGDKLESLAEFLQLSEEETALMYDLASKETNEVPRDLKDTFMNDGIGRFARFALRQSQAGFIDEEDWKTLIRKAAEKNKHIQGGTPDG